MYGNKAVEAECVCPRVSRTNVYIKDRLLPTTMVCEKVPYKLTYLTTYFGTKQVHVTFLIYKYNCLMMCITTQCAHTIN
jgi:hypothetical protein